MNNSIPMTPDGLEKLKNERKRLISIERPKNVKDIETAREHGDISENAEFEAAKERQAIINARLKEIEDAIARAQVIDPSKINSTKIIFGATVTVVDLKNGEKLSYQIVGPHESNTETNRISVYSPLARALIGREEGDEVKFQTPNGIRELEVVEIAYK